MRGDGMNAETAIALMIAAGGGGESESPPSTLIYTNSNSGYTNPDIDKEIVAGHNYEGPYNVWKTQVPASWKAGCSRIVFTDETFDTVTEIWYDESGTLVKSQIFGIGVYHKGQADEEATRLVYPNGDRIMLEGW